MDRKETGNLLFSAAGRVLDWPLFLPLRYVLGTSIASVLPRIIKLLTATAIQGSFRYFVRGSLKEPSRYNPFLSDWDLGLEIESIENVDFPALRRRLETLRRWFPPLVEIEIYTRDEWQRMQDWLAESVGDRGRSLNDYYMMMKWARKVRWLVDRENWKPSPIKHRRAARVAWAKLQTWFEIPEIRGNPLSNTALRALSDIFAKICDELEPDGRGWSPDEVKLYFTQRELWHPYLNFSVALRDGDAHRSGAMVFEPATFMKLFVLFGGRAGFFDEYKSLSFSAFKSHEIARRLVEIDALTLLAFSRSLAMPSSYLRDWMAGLDRLRTSGEHPDLPMSKLIASLVKGGRTFTEVGGVFSIEREMTSVAAAAGAALVRQIDVMPPDHRNWETLRARLLANGSTDHSFHSVDLVDAELEPTDVVYCAYVLHHVSDTEEFLRALRRSTKMHVVLNALVLPESSIVYSENALVHVPSLSPEERRDLAQIYGFRGAIGLDIEIGEPLNPRDRSVFWCLPSRPMLLEMCRKAGFRIVEDWPAMAPWSRTLLLEIQSS